MSRFLDFYTESDRMSHFRSIELFSQTMGVHAPWNVQELKAVLEEDPHVRVKWVKLILQTARELFAKIMERSEA